ncbi:MAG: ABC transporter substrate-binding protein [Caldilineaceae bacterium]
MQKLMSILSLMALLVTACQPIQPSMSKTTSTDVPSPAAVVAALDAATNAGDVDAAVALFTEDAVITVAPPPPGQSGIARGLEEIRAWLAWEILQGADVTSEILGVEGNQVIVKETFSDELLASLGVEIIETRVTYIVENGKITGYDSTFTEESMAEVTAALATLEAVEGETPGLTADEIILGAHTPLTGPVAVFSQITKATKAYFDYINATEGGVYGRKITYLIEDDAYAPPQTRVVVEKLVEQDGIFALVGGMGTPTHLAVVDYLQALDIPDLFVIGGSTEWVKDPAARPTVFGSNVHFALSGAALALHILETYPGQKVGLIAQDTGFEAGVASFKQIIGNELEIVGEESYAVGPPDLSAQVERLHDAGAEVIMAFATGPFLAAALEYARTNLQWDVPFVTAGPGTSGAVMLGDLAAGVVAENGLRLTSEMDHPALIQHQAILTTYSDLENVTLETIYGQMVGELTVAVLQAAGPEPTRAGVIAAAESIQNFRCSLCIFPINLSATDHSPIDTVMRIEWDGQQWQYFGDGYSWEGVLPDKLSAENVQIVPSPYTE